MNAESSDWKRYIPMSDELSSIYEELDISANTREYPAEDGIEPAVDGCSYNVFDSLDLSIHPTHTEKELQKLIDKFNKAGESVDSILGSISSSVSTLESIEKQYDEVSGITNALHDECEVYIDDEKSLTRVLDELQEPLSYFRDLAVITNKIGMNAMYSSDSYNEKNLEMEYDLYCNELTDIINRIFECIRFFRSHPSYKDSESFLAKWTALLNRVYSIVRNKFTSLLKTCEAQINEKPDKNQLLVSSSPLYYYISALSRGNAQLIAHILQIHHGVSNELTGDSCFDLFAATRERLIKPLFLDEITAFLGNTDLSLEDRIRKSLHLLIEVCNMEGDLYLNFFCSVVHDNQYIMTIRSSPSFLNSINALLEHIAIVLYESVRPIIIDTMAIDTLCDLVRMIKMEIIAGDVIKRNSFTAVVIPIIVKIEEDIRERVVYIAHIYIDSAIANYTPTPQDLDYPAKLYQYYAQRRNKDYNVYSVWYTPVQKALHVLSLLYTCVDYTIMTDLTAEAIQAVLASIARAAHLLALQQGPVDAQLFTIKTLLILREQISPFDLHSTGTRLPFSDTSLRDSTLYRLFRRAVPTIAFITQDSIKLIEDALKASTNAFIEAVCRSVCDSAVRFVQQYEQFMAQASSGEEKFPLTEEQVVSLVSSFKEGIGGLDDLAGKVALYIDSPATQGILFAPVRRVLLSNVAHMKEILIHLKPNNFPRYLDQLSELETAINAIDATKYNHASSVKVTVAEKEPDVMKEEVAITKEDIEKSDANRRVNGDDGKESDIEKESDGDGEESDGEQESGVEEESDGDGEQESDGEENDDGEKESEETKTDSEDTEEKKETTQNANNPQESDHPVVE
ncbi:hypothetical protein WA577_003208 [Blastocystis sp. JDR]